jgi:hypothetical protein
MAPVEQLVTAHQERRHVAPALHVALDPLDEIGGLVELVREDVQVRLEGDPADLDPAGKLDAVLLEALEEAGVVPKALEVYRHRLLARAQPQTVRRRHERVRDGGAARPSPCWAGTGSSGPGSGPAGTWEARWGRPGTCPRPRTRGPG